MLKKYIDFIFYILFLDLLSTFNGFNFSIIIAIYNTGRYLDDSIGSILNQTFNFERIQIILVNDGSTDQTEEICLNYKNKFPQNIVYIKIDHGGVSKARNEGIKHANGTYINFLDPDDKWDNEAFNFISRFLENYKDINIIACRLKYFEASNKYHALDYKFDHTRIVNLSEEYHCIQLSASSCIFRKDLLINNYFDEAIFSSEDTLFINKLLLIKPVIGILKEAIYFYRKRYDSSSVVQNYKENIHHYLDSLKVVESKLINLSRFIYNQILPFIQYLIGYEILVRMYTKSYKYLDSFGLKAYYLQIKDLLTQIEDKYIFEQKILSNKYKLLALSIKYNKDLRYDIKYKNDSLFYLDNIILNFKNEDNSITWTNLYIKKNLLILEGIDNLWIPKENYFYFCKYGNKTFFPKYNKFSSDSIISMDGRYEKGRIIVFNIFFDTSNDTKFIHFYISYMNWKLEIFTSFGLFSHIPHSAKGYYITENIIIGLIDKRLTIMKYDIITERKFEQLYCNDLKEKKNDYILKLRKHIKQKKINVIHKQTQIWLINDRKNQAGDNGEYFFRYLKLRKNNANVKVYFVIEKNCSDFMRLQKFGDILDLYSYRYTNIFLETNKIITSISEKSTYNPFNKDLKYIIDLLNFDIIFLNNEVIKGDISKEINRIESNINLLLISSKIEFKSLLDSKYGYNKNNLIISRLPRYDKIEIFKSIKKFERKIIILPEWRNNVKGTINLITHKPIYSPFFIYTEYFNFYNNLINDKRLLLFMRKYNYTGTICLNFFFPLQWIDFNQNEIFSVSENCDYYSVLLNYSLLITDYSSIFFDFGYLKKPIIYTHFDYEEYANGNIHEGNFDYKIYGFGPVCKDIKCTISQIIYEIKNDCKLKKNYLQRIKKFFKLSEQSNNERIFNSIKNDSINNKEYIINIFIILLLLKILDIKKIIWNKR